MNRLVSRAVNSALRVDRPVRPWNASGRRSYATEQPNIPPPSSNGSSSKVPIAVIGTLAGAGLTGYLVYNSFFADQDKTKSVKPSIVPKEIAIPLPPPLVKDLPEEIEYLIIGGGTSAFAAFRSIRSNDPKARVIVISEEPHHPYMRPPISKELWLTEPDLARKLQFRQWNDKERSIYFEHDEFYAPLSELIQTETGGVSVVKGHRVVKLDPSDQFVILDNGQTLKYKKCLLATGGRPKDLPLLADAPKQVQQKVIKFRTLDDYKTLEEVLANKKSVAIVGGGFLGSELACALSRKAQALKGTNKVYQVVAEKGNLGRVLPQYLAEWTTEQLAAEGVNVITSADVQQVQSKNDGLQITLTNGKQLEVDNLVIAVGLEPNVELASEAGLEVCPKTGGLLVNAELQARSNLWIAGDVASFYDTKLGRRRVEHHDHAIVSGRLAGENMTGANKPYWHQSMFWSDLGPSVGFEAIGVVDSSLPTVAVFLKDSDKQTVKSDKTEVQKVDKEAKDEPKAAAEPKEISPESLRVPAKGDAYKKGVVFYLKDDVVIGLVLWNVFNKMSIARRVINDGRKFDDLSELAKMFELHKSDLDADD
jgi:programmed cell death 8 (apoptosis-inducing factor)